MLKSNWTKISHEMQDDPKAVELIVKYSMKERRLPKLRKYRRRTPKNFWEKKGKHFILKDIRFGWESEDFMNDLVTCVVDQYVFKKPRFIQYAKKGVQKVGVQS